MSYWGLLFNELLGSVFTEILGLLFNELSEVFYILLKRPPFNFTERENLCIISVDFLVCEPDLVHQSHIVGFDILHKLALTLYLEGNKSKQKCHDVTFNPSIYIYYSILTAYGTTLWLQKNKLKK